MKEKGFTLYPIYLPQEPLSGAYVPESGFSLSAIGAIAASAAGRADRFSLRYAYNDPWPGQEVVRAPSGCAGGIWCKKAVRMLWVTKISPEIIKNLTIKGLQSLTDQ